MSAKAKMTPEPWELLWRIEEDENGPYVVSSNDEVILNTDNTDLDSGAMHDVLTRIVACVNACAGINPEAVPDLLAAAERITDCEYSVDAVRPYMRHRNDPESFCAMLRHGDNACDCGLLTALRALPNGKGDVHRRMVALRAAIAKAKP